MAEWFKEIEADCFRNLDILPLSDTKGRERAVLFLGLVRKLHQHLKNTSDEGEHAKQRLDELLELKKKGFMERVLGE